MTIEAAIANSDRLLTLKLSERQAWSRKREVVVLEFHFSSRRSLRKALRTSSCQGCIDAIVHLETAKRQLQILAVATREPYGSTVRLIVQSQFCDSCHWSLQMIVGQRDFVAMCLNVVHCDYDAGVHDMKPDGGGPKSLTRWSLISLLE